MNIEIPDLTVDWVCHGTIYPSHHENSAHPQEILLQSYFLAYFIVDSSFPMFGPFLLERSKSLVTVMHKYVNVVVIQILIVQFYYPILFYFLHRHLQIWQNEQQV